MSQILCKFLLSVIDIIVTTNRYITVKPKDYVHSYQQMSMQSEYFTPIYHAISQILQILLEIKMRNTVSSTCDTSNFLAAT